MRTLHRAIRVHFSAVICLAGCSQASHEPRFQFTVVDGNKTILIDDTGTRPIVPFATGSYLTVNFGAGDPYVAVGLNSNAVKSGDKKSFPAALFIDGVEVEVRIGNARYLSSTSGSQGYLDIQRFEFTADPLTILLDSEVAADLSNGQSTIAVRGTTHYQQQAP